ncbi:AAA family ATPase [Streptomyces sp. NBC_00162]|uniref:AAA family ATPase n=1 Tax=Streptomyces sp. NBC_00162 TaxID=2903629 RepID=UPI00214BF9C6|nr:AAA family ATPase [Streptomyces sp. NBC_00162]UUU44465.1 AAA family ATPase [Streptomyces sp. NBC_00162]
MRRGSRNTRVHSVELFGFRGVPTSLSVSFEGASGLPSSVLIFGENGSGKSSIVDAIEWACQGRIARSSSFRGSARPALINLAHPARDCSVQVRLSSGAIVRRTASLDPEEALRVGGDPTPEEFGRVPMTLKRADILRFLDTPPAKRGSLFIDHRFDGEAASKKVEFTPDQFAVMEERNEVKRRMRESAARIASALSISPAPYDANEIERMIAVDVYKGVQPSNRFRISLPRPIQEFIDDIAACRTEIKRLNKEARQIQTPEDGPGVERVRAMHNLLGEVGGWLTKSFLSVTQATYVSRVQPVFGRISAVSLEIEVKLSAGQTVAPQQIFSEGYQDLIALLYFLAVSRAAGEQGQAKVLILDDVLQSVDSSVRVAVMELIAREFKDWQLIITVHDRLWRTQVRDIFQRTGSPITEVEIKRWSFGDGPDVITAGREAESALWVALDGNDPFAVCGLTGRLLEQMCDRMSWAIPISVKRKRGDAYTLADTWPGTMKELKRTSCASQATSIDRWIHLRNTAGAHYNEWAEGVSWTEAEAFGYSVLELYSKLRCIRCEQWVTKLASYSYSCKCGSTRLDPA